jgi:predicted nucleic-acid-binding Zn-ribbon protein
MLGVGRATYEQEQPVGRFFTAVKRGVQSMGEAPVGERYVVAGKAVSCGHCASSLFVEGRAQLNTAGLSFLNLDWANRSAATLTCTSCGRIEWFLADPEEV